MLVAEGDLQVEHLFAMALESEMAGLDDSRMDGTHRHFVDFLSFDAVEVGDADDRPVGCRPVPCIAAGNPRGVEAHGLEPGVTLEAYPELFGDLPLEQVNLGTTRGERGKSIRVDVGSQKAQACPEIIRKHRPEVRTS